MSIYIQNTFCSNIGSLERAIKKAGLGNKYQIIDNLNQYPSTNSIHFLPGVSNFDACITSLSDRINHTSFSDNSIRKIGICAGAQILFESSEEGNEAGLGLLKGRVRKINAKSEVKVPHLGWNNIILNRNHPMTYLFDGINLENKKFYFSHSYRFPDSEDAIAYVEYGERFPVVVAKDNIIAIQFHPEKSYNQGLQLLKNICAL